MSRPSFRTRSFSTLSVLTTACVSWVAGCSSSSSTATPGPDASDSDSSTGVAHDAGTQGDSHGGGPGTEASAADTGSAGDDASAPGDDSGTPVGDTGTTRDGGSGTCAGPTATSCSAVTATVADNALCTDLTIFYYELGDKTKALFSGTGGKHYAATTGDTAAPAYTCLGSDIGTKKNGCPASTDVTSRTQKVTWASASKWIYGAYTVETQQVNGGGPASVPTAQQPFMNFTSGYTNMTDNGTACQGSTTPDTCLALNALYTETVAANVGIFDYDSGHFENHAGKFSALGMAAEGPAGALTTGIKTGLAITWTSAFYTSPLIAGGIYGPIEDYVTFLQAIMNKKLAISQDLTYNAACTQASADYTVSPSGDSVTSFMCKAGGSPLAPEKDYYSFGHWIEADATYGGDYSFSSAGSYGVYPVITKDLELYEVIARDAQPAYYSGGQQGFNSLRCGTAIRKAWLTGVKQ